MIKDNKNNKVKLYNLIAIERQIKRLSSYRYKKRLKYLENVCLNLYSTLKYFGYFNIDRNFLNSFFNKIENKRTQERILKDVLNFLIDNKKIKKSFKIKSCISLKRRPLSSNDYESYKILKYKGYCDVVNNISISKSKTDYKVLSYELL